MKYDRSVDGFVSALTIYVHAARHAGGAAGRRGLAFFGDALAHAILPGIAIGYLVGDGASQPLFWGAMLAALVSSLGIGAIAKGTRIRQDTAIGIVFAGR